MLELYLGHLGKAILKDGSTQVAEFSIAFLQAVYATFSKVSTYSQAILFSDDTFWI